MIDKAELARLYGKIELVRFFPGYKVKVVDAFADLHVMKVSAFPDAPGKWQFVTAFPDFKVQFVDAFPDFTIKFVTAFPGVQNAALRGTGGRLLRWAIGV